MNESTGEEKSVGQEQGAAQSPKQRHQGGLVGGLVLIGVGLLFLAENMIPGFRFGDYWPVILIAIGAGMIWKSNRRS